MVDIFRKKQTAISTGVPSWGEERRGKSWEKKGKRLSAPHLERLREVVLVPDKEEKIKG